MSDFRYYRPSSNPPIVMNLIIINVLVFAAQNLLTANFDLSSKIMLWPIMPHDLRNTLIDLNILEVSERFYPYQIFTHMFAHGSFMHIFFNMFGLYMFGRVLENFWGPKRFLIFYFICGIGAAACHLAVQYFRSEQLLHAFNVENAALVTKYIGAISPALGASGAIMGIFVAFAYLFPNTELYMMFIPIPVKAKWAVLIMGVMDLFGGFASVKGDNIAHFAHLGGAIAGFIMVYYWNKSNRKTFY